MGLLKEFRAFALRGNVVDMAVGIIIGAAFGKIVSSLVSDVIMPPLGLLMGGVDFADKKLVLRDAVLNADGTVGTPAVSLSYGVFINTLIDFLIVAFAIFMVVKLMNEAKKRFEKEKLAEAPAAPPRQEVLLAEIRDQLRTMNEKK
jgi:large conductance mechanosensitive channel